MKPLSFFERLLLIVGAILMYVVYSVKQVFRASGKKAVPPADIIPASTMIQAPIRNPKGMSKRLNEIFSNEFCFPECGYAGKVGGYGDQYCNHSQTMHTFCGSYTDNGKHTCPMDPEWTWFYRLRKNPRRTSTFILSSLVFCLLAIIGMVIFVGMPGTSHQDQPVDYGIQIVIGAIDQNIITDYNTGQRYYIRSKNTAGAGHPRFTPKEYSEFSKLRVGQLIWVKKKTGCVIQMRYMIQITTSFTKNNNLSFFL